MPRSAAHACRTAILGAYRERAFASGRIVDIILGLVVCEWIALAAFHRMTGRGVPPRDFSVNILSGIFLMLAIREALVATAWG